MGQTYDVNIRRSEVKGIGELCNFSVNLKLFQNKIFIFYKALSKGKENTRVKTLKEIFLEIKWPAGIFCPFSNFCPLLRSRCYHPINS